MTTEQIISLVISLCPSVIAIFTTVGVVLKTLHEFAALKKLVVDMKELSEVKVQMKQVQQENYELKKTMNELLTKLDHVERK